MPATLAVKLFASLAELHGWRERHCVLPQPPTVAAVWTSATGEPALPTRILCARNMEYCEPETEVQPGDEVAFFPPVTGG